MNKAALILCAALLSSTALACAGHEGKHDSKKAAAAQNTDTLNIRHAWARATVSGMQNGGVFLELHNGRSSSDALTGGSTPLAERVEVHNSTQENGVMKMRRIDSLPLPAKQSVELKPGSYHIMLMGLKKPLEAGSRFPLTLHFQNAPAQTVEVEVKANGSTPAAHHHH